MDLFQVLTAPGRLPTLGLVAFDAIAALATQAATMFAIPADRTDRVEAAASR